MKRRTRQTLKSASLVAVGLILARGAQATITVIGDTTLTFDNSGLGNNTQIPVSYGSHASSTNAPVAGVVIGGSGLGLGTPDVTLTWASTSTGRSSPPVQFQYFKGGPAPWDSAELSNAGNGTSEDITLNVPVFASVTLTSFNFFPYYNNAKTFSYTVSVKDASNPATILSSQIVNITADATKHLVTLNTAGVLGQSLLLDITRTSGTGGAFDMAVDDIKFTEIVPEPGTATLICLGLGGMALVATRRSTKR